MPKSRRSPRSSSGSDPEQAIGRIVVMARYPTRGAVKRRLARTIGAAAACDLYRAFLLDLRERLRTRPWAVAWAFTPPGAAFASLVPGAHCFPQRGADLGARMAHALATLWAERPGPVVVLGVDSPHLPLAALDEAFAALERHDVVLGPAIDGGYYLIALGGPAPALFRDVAWGSGEVLATTRARAAAAGLRVHLLGETFDVDDAEGLVALRAAVEGGAVELPHTARALEAIASTGRAPSASRPRR